jgi:hypothetical protein
MVLDGEYSRNQTQRSPSDTCSTTNPYGIPWDGTQAPAMKGRRLTA